MPLNDDCDQIRPRARILLPEPVSGVTALADASPMRADAIRAALAGMRAGRPLGSGKSEPDHRADLAAACRTLLDALTTLSVDPGPGLARDLSAKVSAFGIEQGEDRARRSAWERVRGRAAPLTGLLARLETLMDDLTRDQKSLQDATAARKAAGERAISAYRTAIDAYEALGILIAAGQARMGEVAQAMAGAGADDAEHLKSQARDAERETHFLRCARGHAHDALVASSGVLSDEPALCAGMRDIVDVALPEWEDGISAALAPMQSADKNRRGI